MRKVYDVVVDGEPASAKNQRRIVQVKGKPRLIKSKKALDYTKEFYAQAPVLNPLLDCDMCLLVDVWYASRRLCRGTHPAEINAIRCQGLLHLYRYPYKSHVAVTFWIE